MHKYCISYSDPVTLKSKTGWFKLDDVTSVTKEEENDRQQKAKSDSRGQNANYIPQANQRSEQKQTTPVR